MSDAPSNAPQVTIEVDSTGSRHGESISPGPLVSQWGKRRQSIMSKGSSNEEPSRMNRRRSTFKSLASTMLLTRRMTKTSLTGLQPVVQQEKPKITMENTYKMEPDDGKMIRTGKIRKEVHNMLESTLKDEKYSAERCSRLSCDLSAIIKSRVKELSFPRYKYVCHVIIGECTGQGLEVASRCVWAPSTDSFEYITYSNGSLFAVATVYGIYYE